MDRNTNTDTVRQAAAGQWTDILQRIGGLSPDLLDGRHHPCPKCGGDDRFRLIDREHGALFCNQCFSTRNGDGFAAVGWLRDCDFPNAVRLVADDLGIARSNGHAKPVDLLTTICRQKRMPIEAAKVYGATVAKRGKLDVVRFPVCNDKGEHHSYFDIPADGSKGLFRSGKGSSGLFLPVVDGKPRLPQDGESWILCEGVKDSAAYHGLGYLACGLPSDQLATKYVRLFRGCHVVVMPDRTADAEAKAEKSASRLHGVAASVRIGTLPLEIGGDRGDDARDVLKLVDGERLLKQAINDAAEWRPPQTAKGLIQELADAICESDHFAIDKGGKLYRYSGGVYKPSGDRFIKRRVQTLLVDSGRGDDWTPKLASAVVEWIHTAAPELWERPPVDVVNVLNGLLDVKTRDLKPHSPEFLSTVQLPVKYDPAATCPHTDKFDTEVFPDDCRDLAHEIVGWLMSPYTGIQKAVLFIGPGGNGKSRKLAQTAAFLGSSNIAAISLHKIESDRFAASRLVGKLANICPDLPSDHLAGTSNFKSITGGDPITGEYKFRDSFDFVPFARLVFSANHPPRSQDSSEAFFERWIVIPFEGKFRGTDQEIPADELDRRLQSPAELSGLLNHALNGLDRIRKSGRLSQPASVIEAHRQFHATTDPLSVWLDQYTIDDPNAWVTCDLLRTAYGAVCEQKGRPTPNKTDFGRQLKKLRPNVELKQKTVSGYTKWCYVKIGLAEWKDGSNEVHGVNGVESNLFPTTNRTGPDTDGKQEKSGASEKQDRANSVNSVSSVNCERTREEF